MIIIEEICSLKNLYEIHLNLGNIGESNRLLEMAKQHYNNFRITLEIVEKLRWIIYLQYVNE